MKARLIIWGTLGLGIALVIGVTVQERIDKRRLRGTRKLGNQIVTAMCKYRDQTGCFPQDLSQLAPDFISVVDQPTWGTRKWHYIQHNCESFGLSAYKNTNRYPALHCDFEDGERSWWYDD